MKKCERGRATYEYLNLLGIHHVALPVSQRTGGLEGLRERIGECTRCPLHAGRTKLVFGTGNHDASLFFIGEGPGYHEDTQGEPFVGAAGKRLNEWIKKLGLKRDEVYIANIVKCRPPDNRTPLPGEAATCLPFLKEQIEIVSPALIVTLGSPALNYLLSRKERITRVRGTLLKYNGIPLIPTYHPAYILRNRAKEAEVFEDLEKIKKFL